MLKSLEVAYRSEGGLNVTGKEEGEGEVTHFSTFPGLQNLCAELEAVRVGSVSKWGKYLHHTQANCQQFFQLVFAVFWENVKLNFESLTVDS